MSKTIKTVQEMGDQELIDYEKGFSELVLLNSNGPYELMRQNMVAEAREELKAREAAGKIKMIYGKWKLPEVIENKGEENV